MQRRLDRHRADDVCSDKQLESGKDRMAERPAERGDQLAARIGCSGLGPARQGQHRLAERHQ